MKRPTLLSTLIFVGTSMCLPAFAASTPTAPGQETAASDQAMVDGLNKQITQTQNDLASAIQEAHAIEGVYKTDDAQAQKTQQKYQAMLANPAQAAAAAALKKDVDKSATRAAADKSEWDGANARVDQLRAQLNSLEAQLADLQRRMKHS